MSYLYTAGESGEEQRGPVDLAVLVQLAVAAMLGASSDELLGRLLALREAETGAPALRAIAGRPKWDSEFDVLRRSYRETIGVVFCGAAPIAAQLQKCCRRFSSGATTFRLHKENF